MPKSQQDPRLVGALRATVLTVATLLAITATGLANGQVLVPTAPVTPQEVMQAVSEVTKTRPWLAKEPTPNARASGQDPYAELAGRATRTGLTNAEIAAEEFMIDYYIATSALRELFGSARYGGAVIDEQARKATVFVKDLATEDANTIRQTLTAKGSRGSATFTDGSLAIVSVERSYQELRDAKNATFKTFPFGSEDSLAVATDVVRNGITIYAADDEAATLATSMTASVMSTVPVAVTVDASEFGSRTCTRFFCLEDRQTMRAGLRIRDPEVRSRCTMGFTARNANGALYGLTAGHCFDEQVILNHAGSNFGGIPPTGNAFGPNSPTDSARVAINNFGWATEKWIWHSEAEQRFQPEARISLAWCQENCRGINVHKSGAGTGLTFGEIYAQDSSVGGHAESFRHRNNAIGGDSGAPVYRRSSGNAFGINIYGIDPFRPGEFRNSGSNHIVAVERATDVTVWTN